MGSDPRAFFQKNRTGSDPIISRLGVGAGDEEGVVDVFFAVAQRLAFQGVDPAAGRQQPADGRQPEN